jgi:hypothetical protein
MCSTRLRIGPRAFALESPPPSCLNNRPYSPEPPGGLDSRHYPEVALCSLRNSSCGEILSSSKPVFGQLASLRQPEIAASYAHSGSWDCSCRL